MGSFLAINLLISEPCREGRSNPPHQTIETAKERDIIAGHQGGGHRPHSMASESLLYQTGGPIYSWSLLKSQGSASPTQNRLATNPVSEPFTSKEECMGRA